MPESGLSVLIPVYNRNVTTLVCTLLEQLPDWGGPVEIVCLDDASAPEFQELNRLLAVWPAVRYQELPRNVGRSAIRNQLAAAARFPWLLLLDNDSLLPDDQFVARYAQARALAPVLIGAPPTTRCRPLSPSCGCAGTTAITAKPARPGGASKSPTDSLR
ncbi:glycosyltransferase family 2 protein [Hymenobacter cellulosilyticus]|uniref:Glycosyltransferase n=1 Tax=Hymenobacter cellulosilyticus TaxID=2932248 RepID=A0A8T9Q3B4_9BACT|nr:glycosyltransferase [Hymenobacter cellulosilyticus]UOQ70348.1 glycosyltransferase [Hymenobacter cellulosilyticus]